MHGGSIIYIRAGDPNISNNYIMDNCKWGGGGQKSGDLLKFIVTDHIATVVPDKSAKKYTKKICRDNHPLYISMLAF